MGYDIRCKAQVGRVTSEGKALLETDFIQFRAEDVGFKVLFKELTEVKADGEVLELKFAGKRARLYVGEKDAERWAKKILNPPSRLDKLGLKPGATVWLEGGVEKAFAREVAGRETDLKSADLIFLAAASSGELAQVGALARRMRRDAGLWIVYPKGRQEIREIDVISAGRAAGLKDVKVVRFSDVETALKFVVPLESR